MFTMQKKTKDIFDFKKAQNLTAWRIVNDGVMGGVSTSELYRTDEKTGVFKGNVSLENYGGFAMIQCATALKNVKSHSKILLTIKGDGKNYQFRIKNDKGNYYSYVQNFKTSGKEETIVLELSNFEPAFRGRKLNMSNFNSDEIAQIVILIGNKKAEAFKLEIFKIVLE